MGVPRFQFDASWLQVEGFNDLVAQKIWLSFLLLVVLLARWTTGINAPIFFVDSLEVGLKTIMLSLGGTKLGWLPKLRCLILVRITMGSPRPNADPLRP